MTPLNISSRERKKREKKVLIPTFWTAPTPGFIEIKEPEVCSYINLFLEKPVYFSKEESRTVVTITPRVLRSEDLRKHNPQRIDYFQYPWMQPVSLANMFEVASKHSEEEEALSQIKAHHCPFSSTYTFSYSGNLYTSCLDTIKTIPYGKWLGGSGNE